MMASAGAGGRRGTAGLLGLADRAHRLPMPLPARHPSPLRAALLGLLLATAPGWAQPPAAEPQVRGLFAIEEAQLSPDYWIARVAEPDAVLLPAQAIAARNARLLREDPSMHDLAALPARIDGPRVRAWIDALARLPDAPLWDERGQPVPAGTLAAIAANRALAAIPAQQPARFALAVRRADLRAFPTDLRVFNRRGETDIDRFQESALFPGDPVLVAHASADGAWRFVVSPRYAAWVRAEALAEGPRAAVLGYGARTPYRVIVGAKPRTVHTREDPRVSELQLDMGLRLPLAALAADATVNGQNPYAAWALELPVRQPDGTLGFAPALLQKGPDSAPDYLPLTRANLLRQAFKFLGERYGWGHAYDGRDCSGFVSEVYRSMGLLLPRNTGDQARSPVFARREFAPDAPRAQRLAALAAADVGDLVFVPGHVMMVIGQRDGQPWVIHDINEGHALDAGGQLRSLHLNGVSVTPLLPLRFDRAHDYVDRMTAIVRPVAAP